MLGKKKVVDAPSDVGRMTISEAAVDPGKVFGEEAVKLLNARYGSLYQYLKANPDDLDLDAVMLCLLFDLVSKK